MISGSRHNTIAANKMLAAVHMVLRNSFGVKFTASI